MCVHICAHTLWCFCNCSMSPFTLCDGHCPRTGPPVQGLKQWRLFLLPLCQLSCVCPWSAGKLRSPFLQKQFTQPETQLSREPVHAASEPRPGKTLGHPWEAEGLGVAETLRGPPLPGLRVSCTLPCRSP